MRYLCLKIMFKSKITICLNHSGKYPSSSIFFMIKHLFKVNLRQEKQTDSNPSVVRLDNAEVEAKRVEQKSLEKAEEKFKILELKEAMVKILALK